MSLSSFDGECTRVCQDLSAFLPEYEGRLREAQVVTSKETDCFGT
jgi:hypothetical protein